MSRILLLGLGDIGRRLAERLVVAPGIVEVILAGRPSGDRSNLARLLSMCGAARVRLTEVDALQQSALEKLLIRERPDLVIQCAALLSPWHISQRTDPVARGLLAAGFAIQLPAQLPIVTTLMTAARSVGFVNPIVNCSYPDVTHPVLAAQGLSPTIGIGNVGMILAIVRSALRDRLRSPLPGVVRVVGHHAHVTSAILARPPAPGIPRPRVYLGEEGRPAHAWVFRGQPLHSDQSLNGLTAASALPLITALLPGGHSIRTSAPGPLGLPGGYPVLLQDGRLELDLPRRLTLNAAVALHTRSARLDGVQAIARDGTIFFTDKAQAAVSRIDPVLAEPLRLAEAGPRFQRLLGALTT